VNVGGTGSRVTRLALDTLDTLAATDDCEGALPRSDPTNDEADLRDLRTVGDAASSLPRPLAPNVNSPRSLSLLSRSSNLFSLFFSCSSSRRFSSSVTANTLVGDDGINSPMKGVIFFAISGDTGLLVGLSFLFLPIPPSSFRRSISRSRSLSLSRSSPSLHFPFSLDEVELQSAMIGAGGFGNEGDSAPSSSVTKLRIDGDEGIIDEIWVDPSARRRPGALEKVDETGRCLGVDDGREGVFPEYIEERSESSLCGAEQKGSLVTG
jgi:hypothetical protein